MYMYKLKAVILNISVETRIMQWSKQARILLFNLLDRIPITCRSLCSQPGAVCMSQNYCSITLGLSSFARPVSQYLTSCLWRLRDFSWKGVSKKVAAILQWLFTQVLSNCNFGLTAEYPSTPKPILKSVITQLRRHAECRLSSKVHIQSDDGYMAMATFFPTTIFQGGREVLTTVQPRSHFFPYKHISRGRGGLDNCIAT